jgi:hypothetical protein
MVRMERRWSPRSTKFGEEVKPVQGHYDFLYNLTVKIKLSLCLTKYYARKAYGKVDV